MPEAPRPPGATRPQREIDPALRTTAIAAAGGSAAIWWPAFTLGAYGEVFFEQLLTLWAVSTAVMLCGLVLGRAQRGVRLRWLTLGLPTLWIAVSIASNATNDVANLAVLGASAVLTLVGAPFLTWVLLRIVVAGYVELSRRQRMAAVLITAGVGVVAFVLGDINYLFLTCEDFLISGKSAPPDCAQ